MKKQILIIFSIALINVSLFGQKYITIDFSVETGYIKDIYGGNKGTDTLEAIPYLHEIGIKHIRTHDYHGGADYFYYSNFWNKDGAGNFIDINTNFDPANPADYYWGDTDTKLESIIENNFSAYFRIGASYPNSNFILQPMIPPSNSSASPLNFSKFAQLSANTVNHYNNNWDNGFEYGVQYWEIWNEPGGLFWDGNPFQFYLMYKEISSAIKSENPNIKIGAPGAVPTTTLGINTEYREGFIEFCNAENLALDFYSWHVYGLKNPYGLNQISSEIRTILDDNNFTETESHISEINAELDDNLHNLIVSSKGAAYYLSLMLTAQESDIDMFLLYPAVGLIKPNINIPGYTWTKSAYAMKAFEIMNDSTPVIVQSTGNEVVENDLNDTTLNFMVFAAKDTLNSKLFMLVSNFASTNSNYQIELSNLPWYSEYETKITKNVITNTDNFTESILTLPVGVNNFNIFDMESPSVLFLRMEPIIVSNIINGKNAEVNIYPNPTTGIIIVDGSYMDNIEVLNVYGQTVKIILPKNQKCKVDISNQAKGTYFIKVRTSCEIVVKKLVLK